MFKLGLLQFPLLLLALISPATAQFAHTDHKQIVDAAGKPLLVRATNLGNWLVPEEYTWQFQEGPQSPSEIRRWCWSCWDLKGRPRSTPTENLAISRPNLLAENHHPGGTGPPEPRESRLVQAALSSLNMPRTMHLKELPRVALHWQPACCILSQNLPIRAPTPGAKRSI